jgi:Ca-activated chloride channel family protein
MFRDPVYLAWMLPAIALAAVSLAWGFLRRRRLSALMGDTKTVARLVSVETLWRRKLKAGLQLCVLFLLFLSLAGPQWGVELVATQASAHHVMIAVDTSLSMMTEDVKPNRLEKAKQELTLLLDQLGGSRVGVIAFSGEAAIVCPMTTDIGAAKQLLRDIEVGMIPVPGTGIGKAIRLATQSLARYPGTKTLVLISDGEDHKTDPGGAAEEAAANGIRIFSIGVGTAEGEPIPVKDASGALTGYKKDKKGNTVISKLGEETLTLAASKTGGQYFRVSPSQNEAGDIVDHIEKSEKTEGVGGTANSFQNRFMLPLSLAFLLLLMELLIPERGSLLPVRREPRPLPALPKKALVGLTLFFLLLPPAAKATEESSLRQGNRLYGKEEYLPALEAYSAAGEKRPDDPRPAFNSGDALYRLDELDKAAQAFEALGKSENPAPLRSAAYYNLGNVRMQQGDIKQAISEYRQAVRLNPADAEAVHNLAVALHYLKNPPPKKNNKKNQQKDKPKEDQKNQGGQDNKPQDDKQGQPPPSQPKTRPQDQMSREDAERVMRAVAEKEKSTGSPQKQFQKAPSKPPEVEEDW